MEDLPRLFDLLEKGKIKPLVTKKLALRDARKAIELLESGQGTGNPALLTLGSLTHPIHAAS